MTKCILPVLSVRNLCISNNRTRTTSKYRQARPLNTQRLRTTYVTLITHTALTTQLPHSQRIQACLVSSRLRSDDLFFQHSRGRYVFYIFSLTGSSLKICICLMCTGTRRSIIIEEALQMFSDLLCGTSKGTS